MKTLHIEGMKCCKCAARVEKTLAELGVTAHVDLDKKIATVEGEVSSEAMKAAIEEKGFTVTGIE